MAAILKTQIPMSKDPLFSLRILISNYFGILFQNYFLDRIVPNASIHHPH